MTYLFFAAVGGGRHRNFQVEGILCFVGRFGNGIAEAFVCREEVGRPFGSGLQFLCLVGR